MFAASVQYDGNDELPATQPAAPSADDPTRTSASLRRSTSAAGAVEQFPSPTHLRDPARYEILGEHGRGGLGRVSRAYDRELGRDVAIKELLSRGHVNEVRFLREALITARLEHPGIVPVHEAGRWPDGTPFYSMKLVSGRPLRDLIVESKTVEERLGLLHHVIAVADAIAYAHERNIIHRDLKPANVIVGDFGETIVIDWGLAKDLTTIEQSTVGGSPFRTNRDDDLTAAGCIVGTPAYMAPEQERGGPVDQRADVFAIGAMLWQLCSLQRVPPADAHHRHRVLRRAGIDKDLEAIIEKCLATNPDLRYPHAGALAADLKAFEAGAHIAARSYSLIALLAHWTRRHRGLTLSVTAAIMLAASATVLYLRGTRNALITAQQERDRAQLSEASLLLEKDPTSASELLGSLSARSPQYALLLSRARRLAAARMVKLPWTPSKLLHHATTSEVAVVTTNGEFISIDIESGSIKVVDRDLRGPVTSTPNGWIYSRRRFKAPQVTLVATGTPSRELPVSSLLADVTGQLLNANSHIYALDNQKLYTIDEADPVLVRSGVRNIAGNDRVFMVCTTENQLEVTVDSVVERRSRCAKNRSKSPMVTAGASYAALLDTNTLLFVRDGQAMELPTHISGDYALALSSSGLLALADSDDKTWFLRPGATGMELGPVHQSRPMAVAAADRYAAWGYMDGVVVVLDTESGAKWEFGGHSFIVSSIAIDAARARVISVAGTELRVWALAPSPLTKVADLPCKVFNVARSPDNMHAAIDCDDGTVRLWSLSTGAVRELHRHNNYAYGVAWWRDLACSAGFDGRVLCTTSDGKTQEILSGGESVRWLVSSPDHQKLVMATADGKLREFDGALRTLYAHEARPYRMAFSLDGWLLASGADDGSVIVYDLSQRRVATTVAAHSALVMSVIWSSRDLWTSSADGTMKHWRFHDNALTMIDGIREPGSFRFLHLTKDGWNANINGKTLLVRENLQRAFRFDLGRHAEHVELSQDERYLAASVAGEIIVVDLMMHGVATLSVLSDGIGYLGFVTSDSVTISAKGGLFSVPLAELHYVGF